LEPPEWQQKVYRKKLETITGTQSIDSLKKRRINLEISAIKRRVLLSEIWSLSAGEQQ
jgi:hypothetical protein